VWLIVGLGNPGRKYERNRHNVGFRVVDELARRHQFPAFRGKFGGELASGVITAESRPHRAILLKPMEFMNLSGHAVQHAARFHELEPSQIVVIHDELDIDFGRIKLKAGGGPGGHNGLKSIIQQLGGGDFARVRVGIGKPGPQPGAADQGGHSARQGQVVRYVLSDFPAAQEAEVGDLVDLAANATETIVSEGIRPAMNKFHAPKNERDPEFRV
jgi:peptidyl-tRNA hydrolase, PTH1 family